MKGRPYPWKAPDIGRRPRDYKEFKAWQHEMKLRLDVLRRGPLIAVPVRLEFRFLLDPERRLPDTSNLQKGAEDCLNGTLLVDDRLVAQVESWRCLIGRPGPDGIPWEGPERVECRIIALP